ncbi:hypothetical protein [Mycoplasma zalophi]|uniref:hypothetical protein n=1 Tax=Mycoplasma zalophi TaxID=191287 RepID=UPI001C0FA88B|nr:hypothetical protein [Mycoplasma zalophi]MBU4690839.1 hypothetical protein [Mycoplasma zalophi]
MVSWVSILSSVSCAKIEVKDDNIKTETDKTKQNDNKEETKKDTIKKENTNQSSDNAESKPKVIEALDLEKASVKIGFKLPEDLTFSNFGNIKLADIKIFNENANLEVNLLNKQIISKENESSVYMLKH